MHYNVGKTHPNFKHGFSLKKHYCACGKEIHWSTALNNGNCQSCSQKIRLKDSTNHPMFGKKHTEKTIQKMKNKVVTEETKRKISENHHDVSGKNNPFYGKEHTKENKELLSRKTREWLKNNGVPFKGKKHTKKTKKILSKKATGRVVSEETRIKHSESMKGKHKGSKNPMFGRKGKLAPGFGKPMRPIKVKYNNIWMRSSWEIKFAYFLDCSNIKWKYESKTFDLGDCTYTPDFYLPEFDCYIEIKGYLTDYAKNKINLFKKQYPNIVLRMLKEKQLKELGVL